MGCSFSGSTAPPASSMETHVPRAAEKNPVPISLKQEVVLQIPRCRVHLMDEGEAIELVQGQFMVIKISYESVSLATIIKVGDVQWPLTKDEPVVKLDALHYLFSLPMKDGKPLCYGVTFTEQSNSRLDLLDSFLKEHSCFTGLKLNEGKGLDWEEFAPRVDDYNHFLAKAIAGGTGQIVKGIFMCSNAYTNQVQKGGETMINSTANQKSGVIPIENRSNKASAATKESGINQNLKRARNLSQKTEKLSKSLLDGVGIVSGSIMTPILKSQPGQAFLNMLPGEVLLASFDAVNRVLDAAEAAEKQSLSATSQAATRMISNRFGENAGETTEHVLATAGHTANTAWNVVKMRRSLNPASSAKTGVLKNATMNRNAKY